MKAQDIEAARKTIAAASSGPAVWSHDENETEEQAVERFLLAYRKAKELTGNTGLHTVEVERRDDGTCLVFAFTGNGPTSGANAAYIVGSFDPVAGWAAALAEVERLHARMRQLEAAAREVTDAPHRHAQQKKIGLLRAVLSGGSGR